MPDILYTVFFPEVPERRTCKENVCMSHRLNIILAFELVYLLAMMTATMFIKVPFSSPLSVSFPLFCPLPS